MKKILSIIILLIVLLNILLISVYAFNTGAYTPSGGAPAQLTTIGGAIVFVFQVVGAIFSVGLLAWLGIQYMLASPSEKADIKGRAVPYIVGAVMVFGITGLLSIIYNVASKME